MKATVTTNQNKAILLQNGPFNRVATKSALLLILVLCLTSAISYSQVTMIRLKVSGANNALDETVLYYQASASLGFDSEYDAYKLYGPNPNLAIAQVYDNIQMQINGISPVVNHMSMPILVKSPNSGNYTLFATNFNNFPYGTCLTLKDNYTGQSVDLKSSSYTFYLEDTTVTPRFSLDIDFMNMPLELSTIKASCNEPIGNYIVKGTGVGPWNYTWKDTSGAILKTEISADEDTFNISAPGSYQVFVESINGCGYNQSDFDIESFIIPQASFTSADTVLFADSMFFVATNNSINADSYEWSFGDNSDLNYDTDAQYHYADTGVYNVQLTAYSESGCENVFSKMIYVIQSVDTTVISSVTDTLQSSVGIASVQETQQLKWTNLGNKKFLLYTADNRVDALTIYDLNKKVVFTKQEVGSGSEIDLSNITEGIYVIKVTHNGRDMYKSFMVL